jgi:uncharacterized protein YndB with AHSA1/START domain
MRASWVHVKHDFTAPVDAVFAYLSEHENLGAIFPGTKITRLSEGEDGHRNGVGSARDMRIGPGPSFVESVTEFVPGERIVYKITGGITPLRDHVGIQVFSPTPAGGTHLDYRIRIATLLPGLAPVLRRAMQKAISDGLTKVDRTLAAG